MRPPEKRQNPSSPAPSRARAVDDGLRAAVREDGGGVGRPVDVADDDVVVEVLRLRLGGRPRAGGVDADDPRPHGVDQRLHEAPPPAGAAEAADPEPLLLHVAAVVDLGRARDPAR